MIYSNAMAIPRTPGGDGAFALGTAHSGAGGSLEPQQFAEAIWEQCEAGEELAVESVELCQKRYKKQ